MRTASVIERVSIDGPIVLQSEKDWAFVKKKDAPIRRPVRFFKHKETGHEYLYVVGAFQASGFNLPGYTCIAAIDRYKQPKYGRRLVRVLEEHEAADTKQLMRICYRLNDKYTAYPIMDRLWYSELDQSSDRLVFKAIRATGKDLYSFCPAGGPHTSLDKSQMWETYLKILRNNGKFLDRSNAPKLKSHMANGPRNLREVRRFTPQDNPALAAIAVAVSVLVDDNKPWYWEVEGNVFNLED